MAPKQNFRDALSRLAQLGQATGLQLVRITALDEGNRYTAEPIEFDAEGDTQSAQAGNVTVINLAEPADEDGQLPAETNAVAVDVEGKWVILVHPAIESPFVGKVLYALGGCLYRIRPQAPVGENTFADKSGAADINACNIAELDIEDPLGVDADSLVLVATVRTDGDPPTIRYVFDHPDYNEFH